MTVQYSLPTQARIDGVVVGVLLDLPQASAPWVTYPGCPEQQSIAARSTTLLSPEDIGSQVALMFEDGDPSRPLVIGRLLSQAMAPEPVASVQLDDQRLELRRTRDRAALRQGQHHPDPRGQSDHPGRLPVQSLQRGQPHQGWFGADQLDR